MPRKTRKVCNRCSKTHSLLDFYKDGRDAWCKYCRSAYNAKYKKDNYQRLKPGIMDRNLRRKYGISLLEYNERLLTQGGTCFICGVITTDLVLDHNHATGKVRQFICKKCNWAVALAEEPGYMDNINKYIQEQV